MTLLNFAPIWVLLLSVYKIKLCGKKWFFFAESGSIFAGILVLLFFRHWRWGTLGGITVSFYAWFFAGYLLLFNHKFGVDNFVQSFSLSLLLSYILSEFHEYPMFILEYFRIPEPYWSYLVYLPKPPLWMRLMSNLYLVVAILLAFKTARFKWTKPTKTMFIISMVIPVVFAIIYVMSETPLLEVFAKRPLLFLSWAIMFYLGSRKNVYN